MHRTEGQNNVAGFFTGGPPATVVTPEWLNAVQEELLAVIAAGGESPLTVQTDTRTQLLQAIQKMIRQEPYDFVVYDQASFNALWTRTGANAYDIKDDYRSVLIRIPEGGGGYACTGTLSFLSGGDTYAEMNTNNCTHLKMEKGTYIYVASSLSYLHVDTDDIIVENVWLRGSGVAAAAAPSYGFLMANGRYHITLKDCIVSHIAGGVGSFSAFYYLVGGSSFSASSMTSQLIGCSVHDIQDCSSVRAFYKCNNLSNCTAYNITGSGQRLVFDACANLSNCTAHTIASTSDVVYGFWECYNLSNIFCLSLSSSNDKSVYGVYGSINISSAYVKTLLTGNATCVGFGNCRNLSACYAKTIDNNSAASSAAGFATSYRLSACFAEDIDNAGGGPGVGFSTCGNIASSDTLEAANPGNTVSDASSAALVVKYSMRDIFT